MENKAFWDAVKARRSFYALSDERIVSEDTIEKIAADALKNLPSPYNSQSTRLVLLFGKQHQRFWELTLDTLRKVTKPERFVSTERKVRGSFASGYGTVLYFVDNSVTQALCERFPRAAKLFPVWAQHSSAMHQFVIWTALEEQGLGASLQHYNPLIDNAVREEWDIPNDWQLVAQMPFGKPIMQPDEKEVSDLAPRLRVYR